MIGFIEAALAPAPDVETAPSGALPVFVPEALNPGLGSGPYGTPAVTLPPPQPAGPDDAAEVADVPDDAPPTAETVQIVRPEPEPEPEPAVEDGRRRGFAGRHRWLVAAVLLVLVAATVAFAASRTKSDRQRVPAVLEQDVTVAIASLQRAGFVVRTRDEPHDTKPAGTVLVQEPGAGLTVDKGAEVVLTVARTPTVAVPDVVNLGQAEAGAALSNAGLVANVVEQASDTVAPGTVLGQTPLPGTTVDKGSTVTLTVSTGSSATGRRSPTTSRTVTTTPAPVLTLPPARPVTTTIPY